MAKRMTYDPEIHGDFKPKSEKRDFKFHDHEKQKSKKKNHINKKNASRNIKV